jgi:hypothetical protein
MADLTRHPDVVDLAEYAEGTLDPTRQSTVDQHVRDCADCTRTLADLAGLPETLAQAPVPPLPAEVADRLDRAIAAEASARAAAPSRSPDPTVVPMRPKRRWLAPVLAAAAVVGVIGLAIPVLNNASDSSDDAGTSAAESRDSAGQPSVEGGGALDKAPGQDRELAPRLAREVAALSSATFGKDVARVFFPDQNKQPLVTGKATVMEPDQEAYRSQVEGLCPAPGGVDLPYGWVVAIRLDGDPAHLLISQPAPYTDAVAFTCDGSDARILATATLAKP